MTNDRIFIFDSYKANALFVFDKKGKYITQIGSPGMGPGEFAYLAGFDIDIINNNIIIYDFKRKFMYYDLDTYELSLRRARTALMASITFSNSACSAAKLRLSS